MRETPKPDLRVILEHYDIIFKDKDGDQKIKCFLPDHDDRTPSASLNLGEGLWNCYACNQGGDAWTAIMELERCSFAEALKRGEALGVEGSGGARRAKSAGRRRLVDGEGRGTVYRPTFSSGRRRLGPPAP